MLVERTLSHNTCMTNVFQLRTLFPDYGVAIGTVDLMTSSGWEPKFGSRGHFEMTSSGNCDGHFFLYNGHEIIDVDFLKVWVEQEAEHNPQVDLTHDAFKGRVYPIGNKLKARQGTLKQFREIGVRYRIERDMDKQTRAVRGAAKFYCRQYERGMS